MDQIDEVSAELQSVKGESAIAIKLKEGFKENRIILTNHVSYKRILFYLLVLGRNLFKRMAYVVKDSPSSLTRIITTNGSKGNQNLWCKSRPNAFGIGAASLNNKGFFESSLICGFGYLKNLKVNIIF